MCRWHSGIPPVDAPCVLGVFRPRLILPVGILAELDRDELRLVFLHELAYLSCRDLALNWLLAAVETIHWFNPLAGSSRVGGAWIVKRIVMQGLFESQPEAGRLRRSDPQIDRPGVGRPETVAEAPGWGRESWVGKRRTFSPFIGFMPSAGSAPGPALDWWGSAPGSPWPWMLTDAEPRNWSDLAGDSKWGRWRPKWKRFERFAGFQHRTSSSGKIPAIRALSLLVDPPTRLFHFEDGCGRGGWVGAFRTDLRMAMALWAIFP